ncbi:DUF2079 domain-containing protein [Peterkaempfera sp. SMS 1(5)a]|uniref:DUF2079 domain-containing protein n=1 Tax=Peterkaempfera podocarpi TaxID=3232308 RepID=UPI00366EDF21
MTDTEPQRTLPAWGVPGTAEDEGSRAPALLRGYLPHIALAVGFMAVYTVLAVARYRRYADPSWDLGIFVQTARGWASGHVPVVDIKGEGFKALGDHWSPILALTGPLWRLWPSAVMLLVLQAGLFAGSVGVLSETAARILGRTRGLLIGVAYGLSWGLQRALNFEFHEIAFAVPLLVIVGRQLLLRRWTRAFWWSLPLLLVKEDLGLTVAAVGVLLLVNRRWRLGPILMVIGVAWTAAAIWWWIPHFNPAGHFDYWSKLPGHRGQPHDWRILARSVLTRHMVWTTLGWIAGCTAFVALRSPVAVLAVPTLAWRFTSDNNAYWGRDWHYDATVMAIVFIALVDGIRRADASPRAWLRVWSRNAVTAVVAIAAAATAAAPLPLADLVDPGSYDGGPHAAALRQGLGTIPNGVTVEAGSAALAHIACRTHAFWPGMIRSGPPQYIVTEDGRPPQQVADQASAGHPGHVYQVVFNSETVTVVRLDR